MRILFLTATIFLSLAGCDQESQKPANLANTLTDSNIIVVDHSAHWLKPDLLLIDKEPSAREIRLHYSLDASISLRERNMQLNHSPSFGLTEVNVKPSRDIGLLAHKTAVTPDEKMSQGALKLMLRGQLVVIQKNLKGDIIKASQVQIAKLLDALYTSQKNDADEVEDLGATVLENAVQFKLWAPTAHMVEVLLFDKNKQALNPSALEMVADHHTGVWTITGPRGLEHAFYQYKVTVYHPATQAIETLTTTDPYSLSLSTNSIYSQVIDLKSNESKPPNWDNQRVTALDNYEDSILYEMHIRDFSASDKSLANQQARGKYKAFLEKNSDGIKHLKTLKQAGLTHIHLLPVFDIGTVNEDPAATIYPQDTLQKLCRLMPKNKVCQEGHDNKQTLQALLQSYSTNSVNRTQALIESIREIDPYNWGYDPFHYTVPEGSYALQPDGITRIIEFREMVKAIHDAGFRVVMDVVYNHTYRARLHEKSVLDKIVPNYYHRLHPETGEIEQSTCCENTATENRMMGKLMIDSLVVWTRDYKIDGFRFDLMGHQPKDLMLEAYTRVRNIDSDNYFYGEGWNFGEVENNKIFIQASQNELSGTEIGTFNDRIRDAVRGGRPFDSGWDIRRGQGVSNGLFSIPNELQSEQRSKPRYLLSLDQIRIGLTGNLADFPLENAKGEKVTGKDIPFGDGAAGYAQDPADTINYVSKHDNQTLWDNNQYRIPYHNTTEDRVRMQILALAYPMLGQGIPFIHMGSEMLRSKSFLRDSYDYSDWFNAVDFSMQSNNYNVGLPPAVKDQENWEVISELLTKNKGRDLVTPGHIRYASQAFMELMKIRATSPLFRLSTKTDIIERLSFLNTGRQQQEGIIAMRLDDRGFSQNLDKNHESIIVIFNNSDVARSLQYASARDYQLHPIQAQGIDEVLRSDTRVNIDSFTVPRLSAAVFILPIKR